jgi:uncharacterized iron-regulated protein
MAGPRALVLPILLCIAGCVAPSLEPHPLSGRVWDPLARRFVPPAEAEQRLAAADVALLGETHDNPRHHEIQLRILRRVAADGRRAALALEPVDREGQAAVEGARASGAVAIGAAAPVAAGWSWPRYVPLVDFALERGWKIVAANLSRDAARGVARSGIASLGAGEATRLALEGTDSPERRAAVRAALVEGHCGDDSPEIDRLVDVQRARDAVIADRLLSSARPLVIAIVGRGHARRDVGVPLYVGARDPSRRVVSLGMVEVEDEGRAPEDYPDAAPGRHDFVWFTPRAERADPCRDFRRAR